MLARGARADGVWRIGYLSAMPGEPRARSLRLIMETALAQLGYIEGENLVIERGHRTTYSTGITASGSPIKNLSAPVICVTDCSLWVGHLCWRGAVRAPLNGDRSAL